MSGVRPVAVSAHFTMLLAAVTLCLFFIQGRKYLQNSPFFCDVKE
jgi:hypothetical protein